MRMDWMSTATGCTKSNEIRLYRASDGRLAARREGMLYNGVTLVRSFPYTMPDRFISVRSADGEEIVMLRDVNVLAEESLQVVREELDRNDMIPAIIQILSVRKKGSEWHLQIDTDFGLTELAMDNPHVHIQSVMNNRWLLTDKDGRRFFLRDSGQMDIRSRKLWKRLI